MNFKIAILLVLTEVISFKASNIKYDRSKYDKFKKLGSSDLLEAEKVPKQADSFKCYFVEVDVEKKASEIYKNSSDDCKIQRSTSDEQEIDKFAFKGNKYEFKRFHYGFYTASNFVNVYKASKDDKISSFVEFLEKVDDKKMFFTVYVDMDYTLKLFALMINGYSIDKLAITQKWLNSKVAVNLTATDDFNLMPDLTEGEIKVDLIQDFTYSHSVLGYFKNYFSNDWVLVGSSKNCSIDDSDMLQMPKDYMYNLNYSNEFTLNLVESKEMMLFKDKSSVNVHSLKPSNIYQCSIWHNVLPFSINPSDPSYCGIGWGYGQRDEFGNVNSMMMYVKGSKHEYECVMKARAIQKLMLQMCAKDTEIEEKCLAKRDYSEDQKEAEKKAKSKANAKKKQDPAGNKKSDSPDKEPEDVKKDAPKVILYVPPKDDSADKPTENEPKEAADANSLPSEPVGVQFSCYSHAHGPESINHAQFDLIEVIGSLVLKMPELDPKIYFSDQLMKPKDFVDKYDPECCDHECQMKLLAEYLKDDEKLKKEIELKKKDEEALKEEKPEKLNLDKKKKKETLKPQSKRKLVRVDDLTMNNRQIVPKFQYWCAHLNKHNLQIKGRGKDLYYYELYYHKLMQLCNGQDADASKNDKKNSKKSSSHKSSFLWYDLVVKGKEISKKFKFNGKRNGDVLRFQPGCCTNFTSKRSGLIVEWCNKSMRYKIGKTEFKYFSLYGKPIKPSEFDGKSCLKVKAFKKGKAKVHVYKGGMTIAQKGKPTTTVKPKGKIENQGKKSKSTDTPKTNKTEKKDETTTSNVDDDKVEEEKKEDNQPKAKKSTPADKDKGKEDGEPPAKKPKSNKSNAPSNKGNPGSKNGSGPKSNPAKGGDSNDSHPSSKGGSGSKPSSSSSPEGDHDDSTPIKDGNEKSGSKSNPSSGPANSESPGDTDSEEHATPSTHKDDAGEAPCDTDSIVRSLGQYQIFIDKDNKVVVKNKKTKQLAEKVVNAYRVGNLVYIYFEDGGYLKYYLDSGESVRIFSDKNLVAHFYPDSSYMIDDKNKQLRTINNKYGVKATFDLQGNKYLGKKVKSSFRYGYDTIYVLEDDTVIVKKKSGESVVMNSDDTLDYIDKEGKILSKKDKKKQVQIDLNKTKFKELNVSDLQTKAVFKMAPKSHLERVDGKLFEVLGNNTRLQILGNGTKRQTSGQFNSTCFPSYDGYKYNKLTGNTTKCKCNKDWTIDPWTCKQSVSLSYTLKLMDKKNKAFKMSNANFLDKYEDDEWVLNDIKQGLK